MTKHHDPVPLTPVAFEILLALGEGERHGYAILRDIEERTGHRLRVRPGSLYRALHRLLAGGLVSESAGGATNESADERRRYFRLTALGKRVARAEAERLAAQLQVAKARLLLG